MLRRDIACRDWPIIRIKTLTISNLSKHTEDTLTTKNIARPNYLDWYTPFELCMLPFSREEIEKRFGLGFYTYIEDGLGEFCVCDVEITGRPYLLASPPDSSGMSMDNYEDNKILVLMSC